MVLDHSFHLVLQCFSSIVYLPGSEFLYEQPRSSTMPKCDPLATVLRHTGAASVQVLGAAWGHQSSKPFTFFSSLPQNLLSTLSEKVRLGNGPGALKLESGSLTTSWVDSTGAKKVNGCKAGLKASQVYPPALANAVAKMWLVYQNQRVPRKSFKVQQELSWK